MPLSTFPRQSPSIRQEESLPHYLLEYQHSLQTQKFVLLNFLEINQYQEQLFLRYKFLFLLQHQKKLDFLGLVIWEYRHEKNVRRYFNRSYIYITFQISACND